MAEKDFKGRAKEPSAVMQNGQSNYGQDMMQPYTVVNYDGGGAFRDSPSKEILDNPGFQVGGYITKKNLDAGGYGADTRLNFLPPGMFIDNQVNSDIRPLEVKMVTDMDYPGDGWEGASENIGI